MYTITMIKIPVKNKRLLLHTCCAVCGGAVIQELKEAGANFSVFFYNPNIYPEKEYETRKQELIDYCKKYDVDIIILEGENYNQEWENDIKGLENEPETGKRCNNCILHRLSVTAKYAKENSYDLISSTLSASRLKKIDMINECGKVACQKNNIDFWDKNWKKDGLQEKATTISQQENFYRQTYCGCVYSIRN